MSKERGEGGIGVQAGVRFFAGFMRPRPHHHEIKTVRQMLVFTAIVMLLGSPFYGDSLHLELPFQLVGAIVLVSLSALTRSMEKAILTADAIAAGVGLCLYQAWAILGFQNALTVTFVLREALAILFMTVFYFSMMASRSMILNQVQDEDEDADSVDNGVIGGMHEGIRADIEEDLKRKRRNEVAKAEIEKSEKDRDVINYDAVHGRLDKSGN